MGKYENNVPKAKTLFQADPGINPEKNLVFKQVSVDSRYQLIGYLNKMQQLNMDSGANLDPFSSTL